MIKQETKDSITDVILLMCMSVLTFIFVKSMFFDEDAQTISQQKDQIKALTSSNDQLRSANTKLIHAINDKGLLSDAIQAFDNQTDALEVMYKEVE
jgi:cell division protein FtsB